MAESLKLAGLVSKLKKLNCPLLGSGEDWWFQELLFNPGPHRYQLIEWILSKLEFNIQKEYESSRSTPEQIKYLLSVVSGLGICKKNSYDLIEGTSKKSVQLEFWEVLTNLLSVKNRIKSKINEERDEAYVSHEGICEPSITDEHEKCCSYIDKLSENVNTKHLFDVTVNLFSSDVEKECDNMLLDSISLKKDMKNMMTEAKCKYYSDLANDTTSLSIQDLSSKGYSDSMLTSCEKENNVEKEIALSLHNLQHLAAKDFNSVYKELKPSICVSSDEVSPMGPAFKSVVPLMESFQKQQISLSTIKTSCDIIKELHEQATNRESPQLYFSNSTLSDQISSMKLTDEEISDLRIDSD